MSNGTPPFSFLTVIGYTDRPSTPRQTEIGACPTLPFVTRRRRSGQMRGRKPEADHRFTFHGSRDRAENYADSRGSFATVERSMSTGSQVRLLHPDSTGAGRSRSSSNRCETNTIWSCRIPADSRPHYVSGTAEWPSNTHLQYVHTHA